ncbi:MAG: DUF1801 domain-containing protein [Saprospiraceae bacterium]
MTIPDYLDRLESPTQRKLMTEGHFLMLDLLPQIQTAVKWKVPYYTYHAPLCYFSPVQDHFYIGFVRGYELSNEQGRLVGENRKFVRHLYIQTLEALFMNSTAEVILEAAGLAEKDGRGFEAYRGK